MKILNLKSIVLIVIGSIFVLFGISFTSVFAIGMWNHIFYSGNYGPFGDFIFSYGWMGIPFLIIGIIIFYKSPIVRYLLGYTP
ncbi:MAG: hypothetical protein GKS07_07810 [Nitrosopumilus sp.]|nr:MAG: hypothetical protein GKS07_07810 [Nitrosopumilus sp.]